MNKNSINLFSSIVKATGEELLQTFFRFASLDKEGVERFIQIAQKLEIDVDTLCCAVGFNPHTHEYVEIVNNLGFDSIENLIERRDYVFKNDIYKKLPLECLIAMYEAIQNNSNSITELEKLLPERLEKLEIYIEKTVSAITINKYRNELHAIYKYRIASISFAESRLDRTNSGFRALSNEVLIMTENKMIPVGDIFFRENILPEEKRKILEKGFIPKELVLERLQDPNITPEEKKILKRFN